MEVEFLNVCMITYLFIQQNFIECLLCILDSRGTMVNKRDKETCPIECTLLERINKYTDI